MIEIAIDGAFAQEQVAGATGGDGVNVLAVTVFAFKPADPGEAATEVEGFANAADLRMFVEGGADGCGTGAPNACDKELFQPASPFSFLTTDGTDFHGWDVVVFQGLGFPINTVRQMDNGIRVPTSLIDIILYF